MWPHSDRRARARQRTRHTTDHNNEVKRVPDGPAIINGDQHSNSLTRASSRAWLDCSFAMSASALSRDCFIRRTSDDERMVRRVSSSAPVDAAGAVGVSSEWSDGALDCGSTSVDTSVAEARDDL